MGKIVALLSAQGTACAETALYGDEDTPENRARVEAQFCGRVFGNERGADSLDRVMPGSWADVYLEVVNDLWPGRGKTSVYNGEDAVAPTFKAGERFLFVYPEEYETGEDYRAHSGQVVTIIRPMTYPEEYENMGDPMYKCRAADGWEGDIWESELEAHNG